MRGIKKFVAAGLAAILLLPAACSLAELRVQIPSRSPVVLGSDDIGQERWKCTDPAGLVNTGKEIAEGIRPLRVASYNVHKCTGMDFRRDPGRIAEVIRSLDADIISLQEVLLDPGGVASAQMRYLAEKSGMHMAVAGFTKLKKDGRYGNALLSRFPIGEVRLHNISLGTFEPRGIIDADILVGGLTVRVLATHLGLLPLEQYSQVDRLLEILPVKFDSPVIVMGDMNSWIPGSPVLRRLRERLGKPFAMSTYPASFPVLPLDQIWIQPSEHLFKAEAYVSPLSRVASDHLPIVASILLAGQSQTLLP